MTVQSERIEMTPDEFEVMPRRPGWKHEYTDGHAVITPRDHLVIVRAAVTPRPVAIFDEDELHLQRVGADVGPEDVDRLVATFIDAFVETVEYCDWDYARIEASAWKSVNGFFTGRRGRPHPASRIALTPSEYFPIAGAALLVDQPDGTALDLLFVRHTWRRRGLGTSLVAAAMNQLYEEGVQTLRSAYHVANEPSAAWHRSFGFTEEPDLFLAKLRLQAIQHDLCRRKKLGKLEGIDEIEASYREMKARVESLEGVAASAGYEAVMPLLRYG